MKYIKKVKYHNLTIHVTVTTCETDPNHADVFTNAYKGDEEYTKIGHNTTENIPLRKVLSTVEEDIQNFKAIIQNTLNHKLLILEKDLLNEGFELIP